MSTRAKALGCSIALVGALFAAIAPATVASAAVPVIPTQYIAKLYTEGLGRVPDQQGFATDVATFQSEGCSVGSLEQVGKGVLESPEVLGQWRHDAYALAEIAFRAVLNREPDAHGYSLMTQQIARRGWDATLTSVYGSPEFRGLTSEICSTTSSSYGFNGSTGVYPPGVPGPVPACTTCIPVIRVPGASDPTESQLRVLASIPNRTIILDPRAVITVTQPLTLAPGVTIETADLPGPGSYINMARLVRDFTLTDPPWSENATVVLQGDATLQSIWVSGQRALWRNAVTESINGAAPQYPNSYGQLLDATDVRLVGGYSTSVLTSRIDDSPGWSTIELFGADSGHGCVDNMIIGNLVEAYSSVHVAEPRPNEVVPWTDGISDHCQSSTVTLNQVIDATDLPLILFEAFYDPFLAVPAQTSHVSSNVVVSAGNSAYSALAADPGWNPTGGGDPPAGPGTQSFQGAVMGGPGIVPAGTYPTVPDYGNVLWSGPRTHFNATISDGTMDFYGNSSYTGTGAAFINNTTGIGQASVGTGIVVAGMMNTIVQGNTLSLRFVHTSASPPDIWRCPGAHHAVQWYYPQWASGSVQSGPAAVQIPPATTVSCIVAGT